MKTFLAVYTLWWREQVRFFRQRSRVFGAFVQPLLFWALFGAGLQASFRPPAGGGTMSYLEYFFPGTVVLILLFTAIFSTISVIEDRRGNGIATTPTPEACRQRQQIRKREQATLALVQGTLLLALGPLVGIHVPPLLFLGAVGIQFVIAFALTALSFCIAWRMDSTQGFHAIMTIFLMPMWLLSGAFFPGRGVPAWLAWAMRLNPLTYGTAALRRVVYPGSEAPASDLPSLSLSLSVSLAFAVVTFLLASWLARGRTTGGKA